MIGVDKIVSLSKKYDCKIIILRAMVKNCGASYVIEVDKTQFVTSRDPFTKKWSIERFEKGFALIYDKCSSFEKAVKFVTDFRRGKI